LDVRLLPIIAMAGLVAATATTVSAGHEVGRTGLRQAISDGAAVPFATLRTSIEERMVGVLVDVGLYDVGDLYYRVLVRRDDGRMVSAVVDARTGSFVPVSSPVAQQVQDTARSEDRGGGILNIFATRPATGGGAAGTGPAGGVSRAADPGGGPPGTPGTPQGNGPPAGTGAESRPDSVGTQGGGSGNGQGGGTSRSEAGRGNATSASASEGRGSGGSRGGEASGGAGSKGQGSGGGRADRN
jgi:hypothetical protein